MRRFLTLVLIACSLAYPLHLSAGPLRSRVDATARRLAPADAERIVVRLARLGVDPARIRTIVQQMNADDAHQLASHLDQLQAGGGTTKRVVIIAAVVIVVILMMYAAAQASLASNIG